MSSDPSGICDKVSVRCDGYIGAAWRKVDGRSHRWALRCPRRHAYAIGSSTAGSYTTDLAAFQRSGGFACPVRRACSLTPVVYLPLPSWVCLSPLFGSYRAPSRPPPARPLARPALAPQRASDLVLAAPP